MRRVLIEIKGGFSEVKKQNAYLKNQIEGKEKKIQELNETITNVFFFSFIKEIGILLRKPRNFIRSFMMSRSKETLFLKRKYKTNFLFKKINFILLDPNQF
jgi:hypothetical protein